MELKKAGVIKGNFGNLAAYLSLQGENAYIGPEQLLDSDLFKNSVLFRPEFKVLRVISHTVFNAVRLYRVADDAEIPEVLAPWFTQTNACPLLTAVVISAEQAWWCDMRRLSHLIQVEEYTAVDNAWLEDSQRELTNCFLIRALATQLQGPPRMVTLLEVRTYYDKVYADYEIRYYDIPPGCEGFFKAG